MISQGEVLTLNTGTPNKDALYGRIMEGVGPTTQSDEY